MDFLQQKLGTKVDKVAVQARSFEELKTFAFDYTKRVTEGAEPTLEDLATMVAFFRAARKEGYSIHQASAKKPTKTRKKTLKARAEAKVNAMSEEEQKQLLMGGL